jgi:Mg2+ and Co2+ transporter CorA
MDNFETKLSERMDNFESRINAQMNWQLAIFTVIMVGVLTKVITA